MRHATGFAFLLLVLVTADAAQAAPAQPNPAIALCRQQAQACSDALVSGNHEHVVDCTHPKVVAMVGGRAAMLKVLLAGGNKMKADGFAIEKVSVESPRAFVSTTATQIFAILPDVLVIRTPEGALRQASFLLGISADSGAHWHFVDGAGLDARKVKLLFPEFPPHLKLPEKTLPVLDPVAPKSPR